MMQRSKMTTLLLELTLMLLVFSLCSGICLRVFASAREMSASSAKLSWAASWAQSAAQAYKASGGDAKSAAAFLGAGETDRGFALFLDCDWQRADSSSGVYLLTLEGQGDVCEIRVIEGEHLLFSLDVRAVPHE